MRVAATTTDLQTCSKRCGNRHPQKRIVEPYKQTLGGDASAIADYVGIHLLDWQKDVLNDFLAVGDDGKWAHKRSCISLARQNGKSYLVIAMCVYFMLVKNYKVAYTAQNYSTVLDIFDRFKRIFGTKANDQYAAYPELNAMVSRVRGTASREGIELISVQGSDGKVYEPCISFSTRTESSLRGQSYDVLVIDEAQLCTSGQFASIGATTKSGPAGNSMQVFLGTPETPTGHGEIFGNIRNDALGSCPSELCWEEWGVSEIGNVLDVNRWYETNPSLGILGDESEMRSGAGTMNPFEFAQEYLGYWHKQSVDSVISADDWDLCATKDPPKDGIICYGVKFSSDGSTGTLSVCIKPADGKPHVEVIEHREMHRGLTWFADWLEARKGKAAQIIIDGMANAQPLVDELLRRGVPQQAIIKPKAADVASACSDFVNAIKERELTHFDQKGLNESVIKCKKRPIGGNGGFGFANNGADSNIAESCALVYWAAKNTKRDPNRKQMIG